MFGAIIRATLVLAAGAFILMAVGPVGDTMVDEHESHVDEEYGDNSQWTDIVTEWYPLAILGVVAAILIGSAIQRRRQVRI